MVALVRGVHGLRGAVRVEVLTDRPERRFVPGAVLYREGDDRPLTIASAEADRGRPGLARPVPRGHSRDAADTLRGPTSSPVVRPDEDLGPRRVLLARGHRHAVRGSDGAELGTVQDIYRVGETEVFVVGGGPFGTFDLPAVRAFIRIFAPRRGEIVVDAEALDLRPGEVADARSRRARRRRDAGPRKPPRRRSRRTASGDAGRAGASRPMTPPSGRAMTLEIDVLTLFPAMIDGPLAESIPGRIQDAGLASIRVHDLREWGLGRHRSVDDTPYGGGAGMILRPEPVAAALDALRRAGLDWSSCSTRAARSSARPRRRPRRRDRTSSSSVPATRASTSASASLVDLELSIGDYVVTGGELPALVVIDAVIRLLPGRHRRRVDGRGVVRRRPARVPAVHAAAGVPGHGRARRS